MLLAILFNILNSLLVIGYQSHADSGENLETISIEINLGAIRAVFLIAIRTNFNEDGALNPGLIRYLYFNSGYDAVFAKTILTGDQNNLAEKRVIFIANLLHEFFQRHMTRRHDFAQELYFSKLKIVNAI